MSRELSTWPENGDAREEKAGVDFNIPQGDRKETEKGGRKASKRVVVKMRPL